MDRTTAHHKLASATAELRQKLQEIAAFADEFIGGTHQVAPRVELDRYIELCSEIEYCMEQHNQAREIFLRIIRGDEA